MNWNLIAWFAGVVLTFAGLKFVIVAARTLLSKETMKAGINVIGDKVNRQTKKFEKYLKRKVNERKENRQEKPVIYIR